MMSRRDGRVLAVQVAEGEVLHPGQLTISQLQVSQPHERIWRDPQFAGDSYNPLGELVESGPPYATLVLHAHPGADPSTKDAVDALSLASGERVTFVTVDTALTGRVSDLKVERRDIFSPTERAEVSFTLSALEIQAASSAASTLAPGMSGAHHFHP